MISHDVLSLLDRESIRDFISDNLEYVNGDVLDFGCGLQPYKDLVLYKRAHYHGYDSPSFPGSTTHVEVSDELNDKLWDTIICTQVIQFVLDPERLLKNFNKQLKLTGHLLLTYPTNWAEVEKDDLHRFTKSGMDRLLIRAGFAQTTHTLRHSLPETGWPVGYGVVASVY